MLRFPSDQKSPARHSFASRLLLISFASAACLLVGCGKRRPPLPPSENIPQRTELLSGVQRGPRVILNWPAPRRNAPEGSVQSIRRVDVYRLAESINAPLPLTEEEFGARATLIGSVPFETIVEATDTLAYEDPLELSDPVRLRYAIRYVNAAGQRAAFSNFLLVEPATRVSQPPVITGVETNQSSIIVRWQPPSANVDSSTPANIIGYNVYRSDRAQNEPAQAPLNAEVITANEFSDRTFAFGEEYVYIVRTVSLGGDDAPQIESLNSNAVPATPRDTFRPLPPTDITVAPGPNRIAIFFRANSERDVVGYNIYRATDPALPKDRWTKLNRTLLDRTTFQDLGVQSGTVYFYYLTAIDASGNASDPSEVKSETAP